MQFGPVSLSSAQGAILAHSRRAGGQRWRKGRILSADDVAALDREGLREVVVARLDAGDIGEDEAAARIAEAAAGPGVRVGAAFTGRANLYAAASGLARTEVNAIAAVNAVDESITVATVSPYARVEPQQMLATIKIIPFAAPMAAVNEVVRILSTRETVGVAPFLEKRVALISTVLSDSRSQILDKNVAAIETRLKVAGSQLISEQRVAHEERAVAAAITDALAAGADPILVFGASAIIDRRDVIPAAIGRAGGAIERFGMPVDPGNLLLLGRVNATTVIGLPGCARSLKRNGFDFVLERVLAGLPVDGGDIAAMGVGGLLMEIATRPQPREAISADVPRAPAIAAVVLAAGLASRMGRNKLTTLLDGKPLLRHAVEAAVSSHAAQVIVVTGKDARDVEAALADLPVRFVRNAEYRQGLSTSLKAGLNAVPAEMDGAVVLLGDMPGVESVLVDKLIAAFDPHEGRAIVVPTHAGKRGNPVLWARRFFPEILALQGDVGARHLIATYEDGVCEVEAGDDGPLVDIDTPEALNAYAARPG